MIAVREAIHKHVGNTYFYEAWSSPAREEDSKQKPFFNPDIFSFQLTYFKSVMMIFITKAFSIKTLTS